MVIKKRGLGKGLDALLSASGRPNDLIGDEAGGDSDSLQEIPVGNIQRGRYQPRKHLDQDALNELAASIRQQGLMQPILVRPIGGEAGKTHYEIIAGERRWRACKSIGMEAVSAIVRDVPDEAAIAMAIIENLQREDLNPIEEAEGYKRLIDEFRYDQEKVAKFIGKSRAHVSNYLRLLKLPEKIIEHIIDEKISQGHAKILVGLENAQLLAEKIISKKLSVRQTEALIRIVKGNKSMNKKSKDSNTLDIENQLMEKIGMRVYVNNKKNNSGTIAFEYKGLDQMERLIQVIKNNY